MNDPFVAKLIALEEKRQLDGIELIPSENYASQAVLQTMASVLTNKYSEGYPNFTGLTDWDDDKITTDILSNHRYYGGQENIDRIERLAIARACRLFHADHANVQPHSGAQANNAVYAAWLKPGDTILGMSLAHGGHLTHGAPVTQVAQIYNFINYKTKDGDIDYEELEALAREHQPKILLVGYSAFTKIPDFARIAKIGQQIPGCLLMADMAHVAGLIAGGAHPNPLDFGFHVMTSTTHKTLRGPRGGIILSKGVASNPLKKPEQTLENIPTLIDRSVFPGTQGGPLEHVIAAKAVALYEASQPEFKTYAEQVINNAKVLAQSLKEFDFKLTGEGTENHLILIDIHSSFGFDGKFYEIALDQIGLTLNANTIPDDPLPPFRPSGVRLGTPALTTRGMGEDEVRQIAAWMKAVADICAQAKTSDQLANFMDELRQLRQSVQALANRFSLP